MTTEAQLPLRAQLEEVNREIAMRHRVYGQRVRDGQMTPFKAKQQIALMEAVAATLRELIAREESLGL